VTGERGKEGVDLIEQSIVGSCRDSGQGWFDNRNRGKGETLLTTKSRARISVEV